MPGTKYYTRAYFRFIAILEIAYKILNTQSLFAEARSYFKLAVAAPPVIQNYHLAVIL